MFRWNNQLSFKVQHAESLEHSHVAAKLALHLPLWLCRFARQSRGFWVAVSVQCVTFASRPATKEKYDSRMTPVTSSSLVPTSTINESHPRSDEFRARSRYEIQRDSHPFQIHYPRVSHSWRRDSRSFQTRNSRSRSTEDKRPPCSASTTTRSRGKNSTALRYHVCHVSAPCPARNFRSRSSPTMDCAHTWMSGRAFESPLSMSRLMYRLKTSAMLRQCGWSSTNTLK